MLLLVVFLQKLLNIEIRMRKICICGAFRLWDKPKGGQEVKTCILADALEHEYGKVYRIDTLGHHSRLKMPFQLVWAMMTCTDIVILPAHNGVVVLARLLSLLNIFFHRRLHYSVIGGWLQDYLPSLPSTTNYLKKFDGIYVETNTMRIALEEQGFKNISIVPNCKPLDIIKESQLQTKYMEPYRLVTFSRVTEKKGIGTAAQLVMSVNKKFNRDVFHLDIYGPIDEEDRSWFAEQSKNFTTAISYKGNVPYQNSVEILSQYFALLFPTQYYTEGIPGTIIDSYAAGVPVISAKWKSYADVVIEGKTGICYEFDNNNELKGILEKIAINPQRIIDLKKNCIIEAHKFLPKNAILPIVQTINR